jgi:hypothetical protein
MYLQFIIIIKSFFLFFSTNLILSFLIHQFWNKKDVFLAGKDIFLAGKDIFFAGKDVFLAQNQSKCTIHKHILHHSLKFINLLYVDSKYSHTFVPDNQLELGM